VKPSGGSPSALLAPDRLADIRPLERADLPEVAALFELAMDAGAARGRANVVEVFERTLFDSPWVDPELRSLVAVDDHGRIIGFVAAEVRRMRFRDQPARAVWAQHMVVEPAARPLAVGPRLLNRMLKGPQDATLTDTASDVVCQMWGRLGGDTLHLQGIHWVRVFRPWRVAARVAGARTRPRLRAALRQAAVAVDGATAAATRGFLEPAVSTTDTATPLTPRALLDLLPVVAKRLTLYPDYDEAFLEWLFAELVEDRRRGRLVANVVNTRSGRPLGWYVYYLRPEWRSEVMQVAADERDAGRVLDHLLAHAYAHGSAAVRGRLEPGLVEAVVRRRCLLWHRGGVLVHSRHPELLCGMHSSRTLVSRLEGEWWGDSLL
jgi:L-amino acid N-acyltransferase YncA